MAEPTAPLVFSEVEIRSYLPSGWGIRPGASGRWDGRARRWSIEIYDLADNIWTVEVAGRAAAAAGRLEALKRAIDTLHRKSLGRKSVLTG